MSMSVPRWAGAGAGPCHSLSADPANKQMIELILHGQPIRSTLSPHNAVTMSMDAEVNVLIL